ncbi:hypothetical protein LTS08_008031 [Lithohypha guttulata]|uniref:Uncharacterized protein n=1 Tax=Lithohypha guttulata TaxID=1690604 RepID=A0AAN7T7H0_9EURO|nr:hypothetical protein LTR51_004615 [Lithohypha guttulata]KAK5091222.1 hypothetical protein LTR05_001403 [Lithohypha guttulata]KAK5095638.1 hypothetical protein LTS08_008031 [Lithohypha guttulata]
MSSKSQPSQKIPRHAGGAFNPRKATAPIAAAAMALILYAYSVTSIRAAKRNAQLHREADGGQVDMRKESLRRHGVLDKIEGTSDFELFRNARREHKEETEHTGANQANAPHLLGPREELGTTRTDVESGLEEHKSLGNAFKKFQQKKSE